MQAVEDPTPGLIHQDRLGCVARHAGRTSGVRPDTGHPGTLPINQLRSKSAPLIGREA
jgi:hypothetical protein